MKKIVWLYLCCTLPLPNIASATDLYLFFINGDAIYTYDQYINCEDAGPACRKKPGADASETFLKKAEEFSKTCRDCDVVIFHVKPYTETREYYVRKRSDSRGFGGSKYMTVLKKNVNPNTDKKVTKKIEYSGRVLLYSNKNLVKDMSISIPVGNSLKVLPKIGPLIGLLAGSARFSGELKRTGESEIFRGKNYNKRFAFSFTHNILEETKKGFFHSERNREAKFSMGAFLNFVKKFSTISNNGRHRPFDALFMFSCGTGISTISKIYNENVTNLLIAHPTLVPLGTLVSWDLSSLEEYLSSNNSVYKSVKSFLDDGFASIEDDYEGVPAFQLGSYYSVSIYNFNRIKEDGLQKSLRKGGQLSKNISKKLKKKIKDQAAGISDSEGIMEQQMAMALADEKPFAELINCGAYPEMKSTIESLEPSLDNYFYQSRRSTSDILLRNAQALLGLGSLKKIPSKKAIDFSGWGCL